MSEFPPTRSNRNAIPKPAQKQLGLAQGESHFTRKANEKHTVERIRGVPALTAVAVRKREETHLLVIADRRRIHA
jgi:hypothetical protein